MMAIDANIADEIPADGAPTATGPTAAESTASHPEPVATALARLDHVELRTLGAELHELLHIAPDFVWWVARLANWETNRRAGLDARWPPDPETVIPPSMDAGRIVPAMMMRGTFAQDPARDSPNLAAFFDTVVGAITGRGSSEQPELRTTG